MQIIVPVERSVNVYLQSIFPTVSILNFNWILFELNLSRRLTAQEIKFSINDFFSRHEQICRNLQICLHLLKQLMGKFVSCAVAVA